MPTATGGLCGCRKQDFISVPGVLQNPAARAMEDLGVEIDQGRPITATGGQMTQK